MFQKKDCIYSNGIGVCRVDDIVNLSPDKKMHVQYYVLRSVYDKDKVSYIPVNDHQVILRELITVDEANEKKKMEKLPEIERKEIEYVLKRNVVTQ